MPKRDFSLKDVCVLDAWAWCYYNKIQLQSGIYTTQGHEYQIEPMQSTARVRVIRKGAQMGFSEIEVLRTLHGQINGRYPTGALYLFPTGDDVQDFSRARFNPLIQNNPATIGKYVRNTDSTSIKAIGNSMLYLRSARATAMIEGLKADASKLRSVPADKTVFDEVDLMSPAMIDEALERMSHSMVKEETYLSTPSIPNYGIDARYTASDQRVWQIKCQSCGHYTCLELSFPDCLKERPDGSVYRACGHCSAEIYPAHGQWVAQYPGREVAGYWISQLNSAYVEPGTILRLFLDPPNGNLQEVYNSKLAMAYIAAENRLTPQDIYACCGQDAIARDERRYKTGMGVDVGSELHVVIGRKMPNGRRKILYVGRVAEFSDLHDLAASFHVDCAVIDMYPETRKVREFREGERFPVFGCQYLDQSDKELREDEEAGVRKIARTELCDMTHKAVIDGKYEIPRRCPEIELYASQMSAIAKVLEEDERRGTKVYRYRKLGADHYRHATNYFELAIRDVSEQPLMSDEERLLMMQQNEREQSYDALRFGLRRSGFSGMQDDDYDVLRFGR